jgi:6-phosphogluconolactonase
MRPPFRAPLTTLPSMAVSDREIIVCRDLADLNRRAADYFTSLAEEVAARSARFTVALSGGSTPKSVYALLASDGYKERIPWPKVHLFWGDERCVPPDHPESNYRMVSESLLAKVKIPTENVHRMQGEKEPGVAALEYEAMLKEFFHLPAGSLPRFDLILLGIGEDGHTASLFPESDALEASECLVTACYVDKLKAHRLTLTLPVLNAGKDIVFLVTGRSKAAIVKEVLKTNGASQLPAARVRPSDGRLLWLVTADAAAELE